MARRSPASVEEARRNIAAVDVFLAQGFPAVGPTSDIRNDCPVERLHADLNSLVADLARRVA